LRIFRRFAEALIRPAPALVARHRDTRGEGPLDAGGGNLLGRDLACLLGDFRVARGSEPDVVREDRGSAQTRVAVHGIDAVDERDPEVRSQGLHLQPIDCVGPALGGVGIDEIVAAVEHGAKEELAHLRALQSGLRGLGHLADLLGQTHLPQQLFDVGRGYAGGPDGSGNQGHGRDWPLILRAPTADASDGSDCEEEGRGESAVGVAQSGCGRCFCHVLPV